MIDPGKTGTPLEARPLRGFFMGVASAVGLGIVAVIALFFFWPVGLILGLVAVALPFAGLTAKGGTCPNCAKDLTLTANKIRCPDCKHRLVVRDSVLIDVT